MTAPQSVVDAVQEALGCVRGDTTGRCQRHARAWHPAHPCPTAQATADAAWAAAYPEALREAADRLDRQPFAWGTPCPQANVLRRWADESEAAK